LFARQTLNAGSSGLSYGLGSLDKSGQAVRGVLAGKGVSLIGIFAGIGRRSRAFLWLGMAAFVRDGTDQLGRIGTDHAVAKWAIMLGWASDRSASSPSTRRRS
jgi:hypothetical protein